MAAATAKEHQSHGLASDQEREEDSEPKCNPTVLADLDVVGVRLTNPHILVAETDGGG